MENPYRAAGLHDRVGQAVNEGCIRPCLVTKIQRISEDN